MAAPPTMTPRVSRLERPAPNPRRHRGLRWALWLVVPVAAVVIGGVVGFVYAFAKVPLPDKVPTAQAIVILNRVGQELATLTPEENRREVPLRDISPAMRAAVVAAEDRDYYHHGAISYRGLARAAVANVTRHRVSQGGSTITQQYVKNAFVGHQRTLFRKLREAMRRSGRAHVLPPPEVQRPGPGLRAGHDGQEPDARPGGVPGRGHPQPRVLLQAPQRPLRRRPPQRGPA